MPVYVRQIQESIAPSDFTEKEDDEADYMLNPSDFTDFLPQPYKLINKILYNILDRCYDKISLLKQEKEVQKAKILPSIIPIDLCLQVKGIQNVGTLATIDNFVFCSINQSIVTIDALSMKTVATYETDGRYEITAIAAMTLSPSVYILSTIDDSGIIRIFAYSCGNIFLTKAINITDDSEKKISCLNAKFSVDGDYLSLTFQSLGSGTSMAVWLEIHRIPKDSWIKELENQISNEAKKPTKSITEEDDAGQNEQTDDVTAVSEDASALKLTSPLLVLRVKPPVSLSQAPSVVSTKHIDVTGDVIGNGYNHLLTQSQIQTRDNVFRHLHSDGLKFLPKDMDTSTIQIPSVLFLTNGRCLHFGVEQNSGKVSVAAAVTWSGDYRVQFYSLIKSGKDVEFKPDYVWNFSSPVTCLCVTPCDNLITIGLENGTVIVHDKHLGISLHQLRIQDLAVQNIYFLSKEFEIVDHKKPVVCAVVVYSDFSCYKLDISSGQYPNPEKLMTNSSIHRSHETPVYLSYFPDKHPNLLFRVSHSGYISLHDIHLSRDVLQFQLPPPFELVEPWKSDAWCLAANGQSLYMRAVNQDTEVLFCYNLKMLIPMKPYWSQQLKHAEKNYYRKNLLLDEIIDANLDKRVKTHQERQRSLKNIWNNLFETLEQVERLSNVTDSAPSVKTEDTIMSQRSGDTDYERINKFLKETRS